jgi:hypothetical protein
MVSHKTWEDVGVVLVEAVALSEAVELSGAYRDGSISCLPYSTINHYYSLLSEK